MTEESKLTSDQVFQLNTLLWTLKGLPKDGPVEPVLQRAGYYLGAIGRRMLVPSDSVVLAALAKLNKSSDRSPCHPDLWLKHSSEHIQLVVELKAHGFLSDSSNSKQARKLIVSAFDLSSSLAEPLERRGHVVYATKGTDSPELALVLKELGSELAEERAPTAPTAVLGFVEDDLGVHLMSPNPEDLPSKIAEIFSTPTIILHRDDQNDLQPLYFVPWMPGNEESQDPQLQAEGLRELTARLFIHTLAKVGQARPPTDLILDCTQLLSSATYGIFDHWRDTDRNKFSGTVAKILKRTLRNVCEIHHKNNILEIDLPNSEIQDSMIDRLRQADPADPTSNLETVINEQVALF